MKKINHYCRRITMIYLTQLPQNIPKLPKLSLVFSLLLVLTSLPLSVLATPRSKTSYSQSSQKRSSKVRRVSKRRSRKVVRQSSQRSNRRAYASRSKQHRHYRSRSRSRRQTTVRHRPYYSQRHSSVSSGVAGFFNSTILELGGQIFTPLQGKVSSGAYLAIGSRLGPIAGVAEAQFVQNHHGAELRDLNAQLRIYLPLSPNAEIFPLIALGQSDLTLNSSASHIDLGIGTQLNLNQYFAIGGRYQARVIAEEVNGLPTNGHNFLAHLSIRF